MLIIGIDPGITGSICFLEDGIIKDVIEMPTMAEGKKNKKQVNGSQIFNEITFRIKTYEKKNIKVVIEQVSAMPGQGVTSMFNFGQSFGIYASFSKFWNRVVYRAGFYSEKTGLVVNNESINEFGISFGLGIPAGGLFSNVNTTVEFGKRGTTNENLVEENFVNIQLSLSLNDRWFIKRKYN